jgi:hypothetical protein
LIEFGVAKTHASRGEFNGQGLNMLLRYPWSAG